MPDPGTPELQREASVQTVTLDTGAPRPVDRRALDLPDGPLPRLPTIDPASYELGEELTRAGVGRIVAARDLRLDRPVAIKELLVADEGARRRFEREVRISARLQHPAIIHVLEAGQWPSGEPFMAMKRVTGRSLDLLIAQRPTLEERLALLPSVVAVADAVAYAHRQRIIHRDLKPANVLVGDYGEAMVIDWGLARALDGDDVDADRPGTDGDPGETVVGTPAYMPPEQARGEPVDERADVYAIGATLYQLLCGSPPFAASAASTAAEVQSRSPVPLDRRQVGIPADLRAVVARAMAREPAARYPGAAELAEDLARFQTGRLVAAHDYSSRELVWRWLRRHRSSVLVAVALAVVLIAGGAVSVWRVVAERDVARARRDAGEGLIGFLAQARIDSDRIEEVFRGLGNQTIDYYTRLAAEGEDADLESGAQALALLGDGELNKANLPVARQALEAALELQTRLLSRRSGETARRLEVARLDERLGDLERWDGDRVAARRRYRAARRALEAVVAGTADDPRVRGQLARLLQKLGDLELELGAREAAIALLEASRGLRVQLAIEAPADAERQGDRIAAGLHLARALRDRGDIEGARRLYEQSAEQARQLAGPGAAPPKSFRTAVVRTDLGPRWVAYQEIEGLAVIEDDIVIGRAQDLAPAAATGEAADVIFGGRWPDGIVPFEIAPELGAPQRGAIDVAVRAWDGSRPSQGETAGALARFRPHTTETDFVRFVPTGAAVCLSRVGRRGGRQDVLLGPSCDRRWLVHSLAHTLGLWHEQSRPDRDDHVRIHWEHLERDEISNFLYYFPDRPARFAYDLKSVLHLDSFSPSHDGNPVIVGFDGSTWGAGSETVWPWAVAAVNHLLTSDPPPPRTRLVDVARRMCVSVEPAERGYGIPIVAEPCRGGRVQRWYFAPVPGAPHRAYVMNDHTGHCLDAKTHSTKYLPIAPLEPGRLHQWFCLGSENQQFEIVASSPGVQIRNVESRLCLAVPGPGTRAVFLGQRACRPSDPQQTFLVDLDRGADARD